MLRRSAATHGRMQVKIVTQRRYGGPEVLEIQDVPKPVPGPNQVLIRVEAFTVTLADTAFRRADPFIIRLFAGFLRPKSPVLGSDIGGVVEAVGVGVTRFKVGDAVFGSVGTSLGGAAEYVCVPDTAAISQRPAGLDAGEAAGMSYSFLTALPFLRDEGQVKPGDHVLINGASGSIGVMAVQLARHFGAEVTGVCSGRNAALVHSLGANHVIDYTKADFTQAENAYDVIFDTVGKSSFGRSKRALKPGGIYLTTVLSPAIFWQMLTTHRSARRARLATTGLRPVADKLADMALLRDLIVAGAVRAVVDRRYRLSEVADAHRYVDTERKAGDVVVELSPAG